MANWGLVPGRGRDSFLCHIQTEGHLAPCQWVSGAVCLHLTTCPHLVLRLECVELFLCLLRLG